MSIRTRFWGFPRWILQTLVALVDLATANWILQDGLEELNYGRRAWPQFLFAAAFFAGGMVLLPAVARRLPKGVVRIAALANVVILFAVAVWLLMSPLLIDADLPGETPTDWFWALVAGGGVLITTLAFGWISIRGGLVSREIPEDALAHKWTLERYRECACRVTVERSVIGLQ